MRGAARAAALTVAVLTAALTAAPASAAAEPPRPIEVMTRNLDAGTDFGPIFAATTRTQYLQATTNTWLEVKASNIPERAAGIAAEIAATRPDLVSLQEVTTFLTGPLRDDGIPAATHVEYDALAALQAALVQFRADYHVVAQLPEADFEAPTLLGYDVRTTDQDVILARTNLPSRVMSLTNVRFAHFTHLAPVPTPNGFQPLLHGWLSVDATFQGRTVRFIATHLESLSNPVQLAQADELLDGPGATPLPMIIAADFNTGPGVTPTYRHLLARGLSDTWTATRPHTPGLTWPLHGEDPYTPISVPTQRIDLVLIRGAITPVLDIRVGSSPADLTPSRLWPSDHAGVVSWLRLAVDTAR